MAGTEEGEAEFDVTVFVTMTYAEAAASGAIIDPTEVDPHDFAPYCKHDGWPGNGKTPLWSCGLCDSRLS